MIFIKKTEGIKDIPESKQSNRLWIVLLKDLGDLALYFNKTDNCFSGFEVHKIRIKEAKECSIKKSDGSIHCFSVPGRRVIAGNEDFGRYAWHYPDLALVFDNYPVFKKHNLEIESRLKNALNSVKKVNIGREGEKTVRVNDKPSVSSLVSYVASKK